MYKRILRNEPNELKLIKSHSWKNNYRSEIFFCNLIVFVNILKLLYFYSYQIRLVPDLYKLKIFLHLCRLE